MNTDPINSCTKLIIAVLQGDDCTETIHELNGNGFFVTVLSSTGGFLKKKSSTIMIGVDEPQVAEVLALLKQHAGKRKQTVYVDTSSFHGMQSPMIPLAPVQAEMGGAAAFILNMERIEKF